MRRIVVNGDLAVLCQPRGLFVAEIQRMIFNHRLIIQAPGFRDLYRVAQRNVFRISSMAAISGRLALLLDKARVDIVGVRRAVRFNHILQAAMTKESAEWRLLPPRTGCFR